MNMEEKAVEMQAQKTAWENRATVLCQTRARYDKAAAGYYFPPVKAPLVYHPKVIKLGEKAKHFLLVQSFFKYSHDIALIETRVINQALLKVTSNKVPIIFTQKQMLDLYTVMIDESYHAYVAYDSMLQVEAYTSIKPLAFPCTVETEIAIQHTKSCLGIECHNIFELIAVCLAENILTKEIVGMVTQDEVHPFFKQLLKNHLTDESRHSGIFQRLLGHIWANLCEDMKATIGLVLADFIARLLSNDMQMSFDKQLLLTLNFSASDINTILEETYGFSSLNKEHPILKNLLIILDKYGVLDKFTLPAFKSKGWA